MPIVNFSKQMRAYVDSQIHSGAYADVSEVVRAGIRMLMERDGARQFYVLKSSLERAVRDAEAGEFDLFDPQAFEPIAGTK